MHQLTRTGPDPASAILVAVGAPIESAHRRLQVLEESTDGFRIAEEDLAMRGPGDFRGNPVVGTPCRVADIQRNAEFLRLPTAPANNRQALVSRHSSSVG